ncbi:MAG TPA: hypothetical protein DCQ93_02035 [Bacteroidetes bacterium]|nr:hypothetical protein [Bacteroidota bacterium]
MTRVQFYYLLLLISFLFCFLEWGNNHSSFIFQLEYEILMNTNQASENFMHPLILFPFIGEILLLILIFKKKPKRWLIIISILFPGILVMMILLVGLLSLNIKIICSAIPFLITAILILRSMNQKN